MERPQIIGLPQLHLALDVPHIHVPTGQDLAQVLPLQMVHQMAVIGTGILESIPLRCHKQDTCPAIPPKQIVLPLLQGEEAIHGGACALYNFFLRRRKPWRRRNLFPPSI